MLSGRCLPVLNPEGLFGAPAIQSPPCRNLYSTVTGPSPGTNLHGCPSSRTHCRKQNLSREVVPGAGLCLEEMLLGQNYPGSWVLLGPVLLLTRPLPTTQSPQSWCFSPSTHIGPRTATQQERSLALSRILVRDEDSQDQGGGSREVDITSRWRQVCWLGNATWLRNFFPAPDPWCL